MSNKSSLQVSVAQLGAREHYSIPRALASRGMLHTLFTDVWLRPGNSLAKIAGVNGRFHVELADQRVVQFPWVALKSKYGLKFAQKSRTQEYEHHLKLGSIFGRRIASRIERSLEVLDAFFSFNTTSLEVFERLKGCHVATMVDQIDPARFEEQIVQEEMLRWPDWSSAPGPIPDVYFDRLQREWELATMIIVNSEWSRRGLEAQGVAPEKICVLPLAYEATISPKLCASESDKPLKVLWLGQVILRKGIQYLIEAARLLKAENVEIQVVGPLGISEHVAKTSPSNVHFIGPVQRSLANRYYAEADVFVLPTLSDGFALTQLEAMSYGLPVIATPNCGQVVTDNVDGHIVPIRDSESLAKVISKLAKDRERTFVMGRNAIVKASQYSLSTLAPQLANFVQLAVNRKTSKAEDAHA